MIISLNHHYSVFAFMLLLLFFTHQNSQLFIVLFSADPITDPLFSQNIRRPRFLYSFSIPHSKFLIVWIVASYFPQFSHCLLYLIFRTWRRWGWGWRRRWSWFLSYFFLPWSFSLFFFPFLSFFNFLSISFFFFSSLFLFLLFS